MDGARWERQANFLLALDALKTVSRRNRLADGSRRENDAEHSWHVAVMAMVLREYAVADRVDLGQTLRLLLIHDVVEIDAGDTFAYDPAAQPGKTEREAAAAERLFGLLPPDQGAAFLALWREFEEGRTPEARYAVALDRLQPFLLNQASGGAAWREGQVRRGQVAQRLAATAAALPALAEWIEATLDHAVTRGLLLP